MYKRILCFCVLTSLSVSFQCRNLIHLFWSLLRLFCSSISISLSWSVSSKTRNMVSKEETTRTWIYDDRWSNYGILKCQPVCKYPDLFNARISRSSYDELYF
ncbi:uncharacterized protein LOC128042374 isoform X2 [Gossypium raimondii]|uniref:uncharacterized protein LOC128042374 isoform X2 n=1 Tax=Gossypium raimondii TaxID=29730 RepID=UPI00227D3CDA|nr:uncharacterized protein LOC128042374 isoform X2 [Gossypium raimondii]